MKLVIICTILQVGIVLGGPMRNGTKSDGYYPFSAVFSATLRNPRIPQPGSSVYRGHAIKNMDVEVFETGQHPEDEEEYDDENEDLIEQINQRGSNNFVQRRVHSRRYFIEEGEEEEDDDYDVTEEETDDGYLYDDIDRDLATEEDNVMFCTDEDNTYRLGDYYVRLSDPCVKCLCTNRGSKCDKTHCAPLPDGCVELKRDQTQCCPSCTRRGCSLDREVYEIGATFMLSDCHSCTCKEDGTVECSVADCTPPLCVDAVHVHDECCPVCRNGNNCYAEGGIVIPSGRWVAIEDTCRICRCRESVGGLQFWLGHRQAECKTDNRCLHQLRHHERQHTT